MFELPTVCPTYVKPYTSYPTLLSSDTLTYIPSLPKLSFLILIIEVYSFLYNLSKSISANQGWSKIYYISLYPNLSSFFFSNFKIISLHSCDIYGDVGNLIRPSVIIFGKYSILLDLKGGILNIISNINTPSAQ